MITSLHQQLLASRQLNSINSPAHILSTHSMARYNVNMVLFPLPSVAGLAGGCGWRRRTRLSSAVWRYYILYMYMIVYVLKYVYMHMRTCILLFDLFCLFVFFF